MTEKTEQFGNAAADRGLTAGKRHRLGIDGEDLTTMTDGKQRHAGGVEARLLERALDGGLP
jgi:hypothetical protein